MNINDLKKEALQNNIPIMRDDSLDYIKNKIRMEKLYNILEIGTAVGYSASQMASVNEKVHITSIERDSERFMSATKNINSLGLNEQIDLIFGDALELNNEYKYDLIVIDASKSQNIKFFEKYKKNLNDKGFIIIDNMKFHGLVGNTDTIESKDLKSLVLKIEEFIEYLKTQTEEFNVEFLDIGDGLAVCQRKKINE